MPIARDVKIFVPSRDFEASKRFYEDLGWTINWTVDGLAELELAGTRMLLQDFYAKEWAENFMIQVLVDDADVWFRKVTEMIESGMYDGIRASEPKEEAWGIVTYVWDPCGVLIHFTQPAG